MDLLFMSLDMFTDVAQIVNMYVDEFHTLGGMGLLIFLSSLTAQICGGEAFHLCREFKDSCHKGFKTDAFLKIVDREKGFEAFLSLGLACYVVQWQVATYSCIQSLMSTMVSGWG